MGAVQSEAGDDRAPVCRECKGLGTVAVRCECGCRGVLDGFAEETCPRCEGSRVEPCDHCGEPSTGCDWLTKQPVCSDCARPEEPGDGYLLGCEYDRPAEYRMQMEEARRLK